MKQNRNLVFGDSNINFMKMKTKVLGVRKRLCRIFSYKFTFAATPMTYDRGFPIGAFFYYFKNAQRVTRWAKGFSTLSPRLKTRRLCILTTSAAG